jgi:hypothetical protein
MQFVPNGNSMPAAARQQDWKTAPLSALIELNISSRFTTNI